MKRPELLGLESLLKPFAIPSDREQPASQLEGQAYWPHLLLSGLVVLMIPTVQAGGLFSVVSVPSALKITVPKAPLSAVAAATALIPPPLALLPYEP
jgi:hypothetical protein